MGYQQLQFLIITQKMQYQNFHALIQALKEHEQYKHQIKFKRLKRQLQILSEYENQSVIFGKLLMTSIGIQIQLENKYKNRIYKYKLLLDLEYPFNRPQIFYQNKQHPQGKCRDLLDILLEGSNWGPSMMLTSFLDKLDFISEAINQNITSDQIKGSYHRQQDYSIEDLQAMQVPLFQVEEYTWKYMIKNTKKKVIGLSQEVILIFQPTKNQKNLKLIFWKPISQINTAKASVSGKKFNLQISYNVQDKQIKLYFGGKQDVEKILKYLNPIEMIQRKVLQIEKHDKIQALAEDPQVIKQFSQLIEYYSIKDSVKAQKYMKLMKTLIQKQYDIQTKANSSQKVSKSEKIQMQKQQILT